MSLRVFITGASRGIGFEMVQQYLAAGARVFAAARKPNEGQLAALHRAHPKQLSLVTLEVQDDAQLHAAVAEVEKQAGGLDLLINNAGIGSPPGTGLGKYTSAAMTHLFQVNAISPILVGQAFVELLRKGENPKLVNISSQVGSFSWNTGGMSPLYAASKAALNMYTRSFAREATGIISVAVHPGWVQTDMGGKQATLTPQESVRHICNTIEKLRPEDNGKFFNYDGKLHGY